MKDACAVLLVTCFTLASCSRAAPQTPQVVSVPELAKHPEKYDGKLVSIRAWFVSGWEGDSFLYDSLNLRGQSYSSRDRVWVYCEPELRDFIWGEIKYPYFRHVEGTFVGYFHFAPTEDWHAKYNFDPSPLQLETVGVFNVSLPALE